MENIFNQCDSLVILPDISKWYINNVKNIKDIFPSSSSYNFESKSLSEKINNYHKSLVVSSDYSSGIETNNIINNETYNNYNDDLFNNNSESYNEYYEHFYD